MEHYTTTTTSEPVRMERLRSRLPAPMPPWMRRPLRVVPVVVALNVLVYVAWLYASSRAQAGDSSAIDFMNANFIVSWNLLRAGRFWTLLTSEFSHFEWWHIGINMVVFWSFGAVLERLLGGLRFLTFYLVSAVVASMCHSLISAAMGKAALGALGASGAVCAMLLVYALLFPKARILVFGIIPVPALAGALFFVGLDVWGLIAQGQGGGLPIGHGAHLGGAFCGWLFWYFAYRHRFVRKPQPAPQGLGLTSEEARTFDRLRAKLTHEGPESLSEDEAAFLRSLRERALR